MAKYLWHRHQGLNPVEAICFLSLLWIKKSTQPVMRTMWLKWFLKRNLKMSFGHTKKMFFKLVNLKHFTSSKKIWVFLKTCFSSVSSRKFFFKFSAYWLTSLVSCSSFSKVAYGKEWLKNIRVKIIFGMVLK